MIAHIVFLLATLTSPTFGADGFTREAENHVLPVILISSDLKNQTRGIALAHRRFKSVLHYTNEWYRSRAGSTFRVLDPIVLESNVTSAQWIALSKASNDEAKRLDFLYQVKSEFRRQLPFTSKMRYVVSVYVKNGANVWLGAAADQGIAAIPPRATSVRCPASSANASKRCTDAAYAIAHELGHLWDLDHSCETFARNPKCHLSVMQSAKPPEAILLEEEKALLRNNPFFETKP